MNFLSWQNYWGGGGQNDMFAPPPPQDRRLCLGINISPPARPGSRHEFGGIRAKRAKTVCVPQNEQVQYAYEEKFTTTNCNSICSNKY